MSVKTPEWYRRQAEKMLEAAELAEAFERMAAGDDLPHGTVVSFTKEWSGVSRCHYAAVKVQTESGRGDGWYRTGRNSAVAGMASYSWRALLEWVGVENLGTITVMEPGRRLVEEDKTK